MSIIIDIIMYNMSKRSLHVYVLFLSVQGM